MMRLHTTDEEGVSNLVEYMIISGILVVLLIVMTFAVNAIFMEGPSDRLAYHSFTDIGNGISTRIVDVYVLAPDNGSIVTAFDIPDDVAGQDYQVSLDVGHTADQQVMVSRDNVMSEISIAGIGATMGVAGDTTGSGVNRITYNSEGFE
ncbi:hypothetical protein J2129_002407 [Methanofollis sp. W23]|uniref:DUF7266 family protein n=1 Tax=Methanofollis sp. W23 TaxID=2817849 RepID=UPI001AE43834|nr:hypothetical protein [Methanofollis sp. W23]MBP2146953.1 hypothetical protein [Methanofollis sp. W23]